MARLIVALHDVTPVHAARLQKAEALLRDLAIKDVAYLLVPRFHGVPSDEDPAFIRWCRTPRDFRIHWLLHGYLHQEVPHQESPADPVPSDPHRRSAVSAKTDPPSAWWKRRLLTANEGEFLALQGDALHDRLTQGRDIFRRCLDADPNGFVPPAWLSNPALQPALRDLGFAYTEDHQRLYQLQLDRSRRAPVITWATRTLIRRVGSRIVCEALHTLWRTQPLLRVALHPHDFDHSATVDSITRLLRTLLRERELIPCTDALFDIEPTDAS